MEEDKRILDEWLKKNYKSAKAYIINGCFLFTRIAWDEDLFGQAIINLYHHIETGNHIRENEIQNLLFVIYRNLFWTEGVKNEKRDNHSLEQMVEDKAKRLNEFLCKEEEEYTEDPMTDPRIIPQLRQDIVDYLKDPKYVQLWDRLVQGDVLKRGTEEWADWFYIKLFLQFKYKILPKLKKLKTREPFVFIYNPITYELEAKVESLHVLGRYISIPTLYKELAKKEYAEGEPKICTFYGYIIEASPKGGRKCGRKKKELTHNGL